METSPNLPKRYSSELKPLVSNPELLPEIDRFKQIAQVIAQASQDITHIGVYGSQATGTATPDSDIDVLVLVKPGLGVGAYMCQGPIGKEIKRVLEKTDFSVGKGAGQIDFDLAKNTVLDIPPEKRTGVARFMLHGFCLYPPGDFAW